MKKTISINISGVIFHIEEDGYDKLKSYLTSIQQYFSTYEDSQEIITDIENRIAEKLLNKLKGTDKQALPRQAVTLEDVNELIQSMGTVADFEAIEEEDILGSNTAGGTRQHSAYESATTGGTTAGASAGTSTATAASASTAPPRKLFRDLRRKLLGGVASGVAHYFSIDPVWVRLVFVTLVLALPPFAGSIGNSDGFFAGVSGVTVILYIAMWVAFPGSMALEDDKSIKKFYRNPDDKVLGGVASGIGAYFGIDSGVVRLLFVLSIFLFGTGLLAYIILWIISPEAQTLTEKMEMQGEPITLTNIEHNIKRSLNINESTEENTVTKILLFPFRLIATVFNGLGQALGPLARGLVSVIRVLAGVFLIVMGFAIMIAMLSMLGVALGFLTNSSAWAVPNESILHMIRSDLNAPMILSGFAAGFLPGLALAILGVMLISQRALVSARVSLALLSIWFLALIGLAVTIPPVVAQFNRSGIVEESQVLRPAPAVPTLAVNDLDDDGDFSPSIELEGYDGADWKIVQRMRSQGTTRQQAQQNARAITYNWAVRDSLVRFDNVYELKRGALFRGQDLDIMVYVPYERPFRMTDEFARFIRNTFGNREIERMESTLWKFTKTDGLVSINYPRERNDNERFEDFDTNDAIDETLRNELGDDFGRQGDYNRQFDVTNFSKIDIGGAFAVRVRRGDTFKVVADGEEDDIDDLRVRVEGGELHVDYRNEGIFEWRNRRRVGLTVTMPTVESIHFSGATQSIITGFENLAKADVNLSGACRTLIDVKASSLDLGLSGASKAKLRGRTDRLNADLSGACKLDAQEMRVGRADVEASGASKAEFGQVEDLRSNTSGASSVSGTPSRANSGDM